MFFKKNFDFFTVSVIHLFKFHNIKEFVEGLDKEIAGYKNQKISLAERLERLNTLIDTYKNGLKPEATEEEKLKSKVVEETVTSLFVVMKWLPTANEQELMEKEAKEGYDEPSVKDEE